MISVSSITELVNSTIYDLEPEELPDFILKHEWSASTFKNSYRSANNFISTSLMVLDVDNAEEEKLSLEDACKLFKSHKHIISTTKSHQVLKNNKVEDRYRVILFLDRSIDNRSTFSSTWNSLYNQYKFIDSATKDESRFWFRSTEIISYNLENDTKLVKVVEAEKRFIQINHDAKEVNGIRGITGVDFAKCPKYMPRCVFLTMHGSIVPGERSRIFFILAKYLRNQGQPKDNSYNLLKSVSRLNNRLYPEVEQITSDEIWTQHINSAYSERGMNELHVGTTGTSYDNELLKKYCDVIHTGKPCILHGKKEAKALVTSEEIFTRFNDYALNFDKNLIRTGIEFLDKNLKISTGTVNVLAAANGTGKTSSLLTILKNANQEGFRSVMFSMDMGSNLLYLKLAQLATEYTQEQIFQSFKATNKAVTNDIKDKINEAFKLTTFDFSSTQTMDDIRNKVYEIENKTGEKVKFVGCDYLSRISGPYSDAHANTSFNSIKSVEIANDVDAAFMYLVQVSRNVGNGKSPLRSSRVARDSGQVEECASSVTTLWRPWLGDANNDNYCRMYLGKNRFGASLEQLLGWNGQKGLVYDLSPEELQWYKDNLEEHEDQGNHSRFTV